jgi:hypothetical protein
VIDGVPLVRGRTLTRPAAALGGWWSRVAVGTDADVRTAGGRAYVELA